MYLNGNDFGDFESALDLVNHAEAEGLHGLRDGHDSVRPRAPPNLIVIHRGMQRMELQLGISKPVAQFGDLLLVVIVKVLARAEYFHRGYPRLLNAA